MSKGKRIKERREFLGLSQSELADLINVSKQSLYKYENDIVTNIPSDKIESLAKKLRTSPAYLMEWIDDPMDDSYNYDLAKHSISIERLEELDILERKLQSITDEKESKQIINRINRIKKIRDKVFDLTNFNAVRINVYGSVPAGVPLEAIQDIVDWEEIPADWESGGNKYIGLKIKGDSMEPKYIEGDTVIVKLQPDCENGQDCIVYVNGYDATLKKVVKKQDCIVLQPLNASKYEPKIYDYNDEENPVNILGVVVQIRRDV